MQNRKELELKAQQMRAVALYSVILGTVAVTLSVIIVPFLHSLISSLDANVKEELHYCSRTKQTFWRTIDGFEAVVEPVRRQNHLDRKRNVVYITANRAVVSAPISSLPTCCSCGIGETGPPGLPGDEGKCLFFVIYYFFWSGRPPGANGRPGEHGRPGPDARAPRLGDIDWCYECPEAPAGQAGRAGPRGLPGLPGRDGDEGKPGAPGEPGDSGLPGPPGIEGLPGEKGLRGSDGVLVQIPGRAGAPGPPGPVGPPGPPGPRGQPGYDGEPGQPGSVGDPGRDGEDGKDGEDGRDGARGEDGGSASCDHCPLPRTAGGF